MAPITDSDDGPKGQRRVLGEYRQQGKRFIPPFRQLPNLKESRWIDDRLPECIWVALLLHVLGLRPGVAIVMSIASAAAAASPSPKRSFAGLSDYATLTSGEKHQIRAALEDEGTLAVARRALSALTDHYEEFPLGFLGDSEGANPDEEGSNLSDLREAIAESGQRHSTLGVHVQTTTLYISMANGVLKLTRGVGPENLDAILDYPATDESKRVAAFVRSASLAIFSQDEPSAWTRAFWQTGRNLQECEVLS